MIDLVIRPLLIESPELATVLVCSSKGEV